MRFQRQKSICLAVTLAVSTLTALADEEQLPEVNVKAKQDKATDLPKPYAGGQVARGAKIGILGNQDMMDVPFSFTSYTAETIENQQAQSIADVLSNDPSVRTGQAFGTAAQSFVIRGFNLGAEDLSFNGLFGLLPRQLPAIEGIERIELFKGSSAFLNGVAPSGSGMGGGVNLVPKRADDAPLTRLKAEYLADGQLGGHLDIGRRFGADNQFGVRVNALRRAGDTAIDNENNQLTFGTIGLDFIGSQSRLSADIGYQKRRIQQPRLAVRFVSTIDPKAPDSDTNYSQPWTFTNAESTYGMVRGEYNLSKNLTAYAALGASHNNELGDLDSPLSVTNNGSATGFRFANVFNTSAITGEAGLRATFETGSVKHSINLATTGLKEKQRNDFEFYFAPIATNINHPVNLAQPSGAAFITGNLRNPDVTARIKNNSIAISDTLSFIQDKVLLTIGLRRQTIKAINYNNLTGLKSDEYDESINSPIYGVVVKPTHYLSIYANHIEGLSQGQIAPIGTANAGQALSPFESNQKELGAKFDFGTFGAGIALYEIERPSAITNAANIFTNDGEQRNRGLELTAFGEPVNGWRLLGGATFTDAELTKTQGGLNDGNTSFGVPKQQYNVGTELDVFSITGLTLTGRWTYTGSQYVDQTNNLSIPSWHTVDIGARYITKISNRDVVLRANIDNLLDNDYWSAVSPTFGQVMLGAPRTVKLSATFDF